MLKTTTITIKTEPDIKSAAKDLSRIMGLSLSDTINVLLRNFIRDKRLVSAPYEFPIDDEGEYKESFVKEIQKRSKLKNIHTFHSTKEFFRQVNSASD